MARSGVMDSSVAAMVWVEKGYKLVGVTYRTFDQISKGCMEKEKGCCSVDAIFEAKRLATELGFGHTILDIRKEFQNSVIVDFIDENLNGRTPNPCVVCNSDIKWGKLIEIADEQGCDYIATGHYARIAQANGRYFLQKGRDEHKDQTYFLWKLSQENLARTLFPLGELTKSEVRQAALDHGFEKLSKKGESQEICFIPDNDYRAFLAEHVDGYAEKYGEGEFVDAQGKVLGKHKGFPNYTIGQRKGLGIALGEPMYVLRLDVENNRVVLGRKEELQTQMCYAKAMNWMKVEDFTDGMEVMAKIRYKSKPGKATLYHEDERVRIVFHEPIDSVTPGQSVVLYQGEDVVGGGVLC